MSRIAVDRDPKGVVMTDTEPPGTPTARRSIQVFGLRKGGSAQHKITRSLITFLDQGLSVWIHRLIEMPTPRAIRQAPRDTIKLLKSNMPLMAGVTCCIGCCSPMDPVKAQARRKSTSLPESSNRRKLFGYHLFRPTRFSRIHLLDHICGRTAPSRLSLDRVGD